MRRALGLGAVVLLAAGGYGLLATTEPLEADSVRTWRLVHGTVVLGGLVLLAAAVWPRGAQR